MEYRANSDDFYALKRALDFIQRLPVEHHHIRTLFERAPGFLKFVRGRIEQQRPGIGYGGGFEGFFARGLAGYVTGAEEVPFADNTQLLWDMIEDGDLSFAGVLYVARVYRTFTTAEGQYGTLPTHNSNLMLRICLQADLSAYVGAGGPTMHLVGRTFTMATLVLYLCVSSHSGLLWVVWRGVQPANTTAYLMQTSIPNSSFVAVMRLGLLTFAAERGRKGEAPPFIISRETDPVQPVAHSVYATTAAGEIVPNFPGSGLRDVYVRFVEDQKDAALALLQKLPNNGWLWHYLDMYHPEVPMVAFGMDEYDVAYEASRRVDVAYAASGRALTQWTRETNQIGRQLLQGQWPDQPGVNPASIVPVHRFQGYQGARVNPDGLMLRVPRVLEQKIALCILGFDRLQEEGRLMLVQMCVGLQEDLFETVDATV